MRARLAVAAAVILLGDVPGTGGAWQEGVTDVAAPVPAVRGWLTDYARWPERFPDVESARVVGRAADGRTTVAFRSRIVGRPITIRVRETAAGLEYDGEGRNVTTRGRILLTDLGGGRTRVRIMTTAELHGALRWVVAPERRRDRALAKIGSDLEALIRLAEIRRGGTA